MPSCSRPGSPGPCRRSAGRCWCVRRRAWANDPAETLREPCGRISPRRAGGPRRRRRARSRASRRRRGRRPRGRPRAASSVRPQRTTLYSSAHAAAVVGDGAVLERDAAAVGEEAFVERAQPRLAAMRRAAAPAGSRTRRRARTSRPRRRRRRPRARAGTRRPRRARAGASGSGCSTGGRCTWRARQRPGAEVDAQLHDVRMLVAVGGDRHRHRRARDRRRGPPWPPPRRAEA